MSKEVKMKEIKIVSFDNRGRIVVPKIIRKSLGLSENSQLMMVADTETKEIRITPVAFNPEKIPVKFRIKITAFIRYIPDLINRMF